MEEKFYGVDVSKDTLEIASGRRVERIENTKSAIRSFIASMPAGSIVALEATNTYHLTMADACFCAGMRVYVVNPRVTRHYREVRSLRGHTDRVDAQTLALFIEREHEQLRPYVPKSADQRRIEVLIRRRSKVVGIKTQLRQSAQSVKEVRSELDAVIDRLDAVIAKMEMLIDKLLESDADRDRIAGISGVGRVVSAALVADLRAAQFKNADAFVAFYGLDPRPNDSGKKKGRRRLSKQGQRLGRTLLYNAAMAGVKTKVWAPIYKRYLARGLSKIQALVVIARKIARAAWSIYTHKTTFDPARICTGLT
jgi:transposase